MTNEMWLRLPCIDSDTKKVEIKFYCIPCSQIKFFRGWRNESGEGAEYGSVIYFFDGFSIKVDVPEAQLSAMLQKAGAKVAGFPANG